MNHHKPHKVLFICKKRMHSGGGMAHGHENKENILSSGLFNSALFVSQMLNEQKIESKVITVVDNNCIDREVTSYKPTDVIIEALWVVPEKFKILAKLHPTVKWHIRLHSEIPFLGNEGIAMEWLFKYAKMTNVFVTANTKHLCKIFENMLKVDVNYTPNYYPLTHEVPSRKIKYKNHIDVSCFGAIRPFKNQFLQAIAAMRFAESIGKKLVFHMNGTRIEQNGNAVFKNIFHLFENSPKHKLVFHEWMPHDEFIKLITTMDISMQVSFTETFNIVTADAVANNVPVVVSKEISWVDSKYQADPSDVDDVVEKLKIAYAGEIREFHRKNREKLEEYNKKSIESWIELFSKNKHEKKEHNSFQFFRKFMC